MTDNGPLEEGRLLFEAAHDLVAGLPLEGPESLRSAAREVVELFGYEAPGPERQNQRALLRFAAKIGGVFRMRKRHAPGLFCYGSTVSGPLICNTVIVENASVTGSGLSAREAFEACIGEAIEYASQFGTNLPGVRYAAFRDIQYTPNDSSLAALVEDQLRRSGRLDHIVCWLPAVRMDDRAPTLVPADLIIRDTAGFRGHDRDFALGCAAAPTLEEAIATAFREVIERDAVAMWWIGRRPGKPIGLELLVRGGISDLMAAVRGEGSHRSTSLLDLGVEFGFPVVCAASFNQDGQGFAAGFACSETAEVAIRSALLELAQMELGADLLSIKRLHLGEEGLSEAEIRQLARSRDIALHSKGVIDGFLGTGSIVGAVSQTRQTREDHFRAPYAAGIRAYSVDLTRGTVGVPVAAVLAPALQPYPSCTVTPRLADMIRQTSGESGARPPDLI